MSTGSDNQDRRVCRLDGLAVLHARGPSVVPAAVDHRARGVLERRAVEFVRAQLERWDALTPQERRNVAALLLQLSEDAAPDQATSQSTADRRCGHRADGESDRLCVLTLASANLNHTREPFVNGQLGRVLVAQQDPRRPSLSNRQVACTVAGWPHGSPPLAGFGGGRPRRGSQARGKICVRGSPVPGPDVSGFYTLHSCDFAQESSGIGSTPNSARVCSMSTGPCRPPTRKRIWSATADATAGPTSGASACS